MRVAPGGQVGIDVVWLCLTSMYPLGNTGPGGPSRPLGPPGPDDPTNTNMLSWSLVVPSVCLLVAEAELVTQELSYC